MTLPIAKWRTRTGYRLTSPGESLSVDVSAVTNLGTEQGIDRVEFQITDSTGVPVVREVGEKTRRQPNFNTQVSPRTGTTAMRKIDAYGFDLAASDYANGKVTVSATVYTAAGTRYKLPDSLVVHNNKTTDTRPLSSVMYVSPTGDDLNAGTNPAFPLLSIQKAVDNLAAISTDVGGAEVVLQTGTHDWANSYYSTVAMHTSDDWWLTIRAEAGAKIQRDAAIAPDGGTTYLGTTDHLRVNGGSGDVNILLILEDNSIAQIERGDLKANLLTTGRRRLAIEGGIIGGTATSWDVTYSEHDADAWDNVADANNANTDRYAYCCTMQNVDRGWRGYQDLMDCEVAYWTAIALEATGNRNGESSVNCRVAHQRYDHEVFGLLDTDDCLGNVSFAPGGAGEMVISIPLANLPLVALSGGNLDIAEWVGGSSTLESSERWGIEIAGATSAGNNSGAVPFEVLSHSVTATDIEITVANGGTVVTEVANASTTIRTANRLASNQGLRYTDLIHTDILQTTGGTWVDGLHENMETEDVKGARGWVLDANTSVVDRVALVNCSDGGFAATNNDFDSPSISNLLLLNCTFAGSIQFNGSAVAGCEMRQTVMGGHSGIASFGVIDDCHNINGAAPTGATNHTTGAWFLGDPETAPFSYEPAAGQLGGAATDIYNPSILWWTGAGAPTKGVWRDTGDPTYNPSVVEGLVFTNIVSEAQAVATMGTVVFGDLVFMGIPSTTSAQAITLLGSRTITGILFEGPSLHSYGSESRQPGSPPIILR